MKEQISKYLNRYLTFTEEEMERFYNCLTPRSYSKNDFLLQEGEVCKNDFFIINGVVRIYYIDHKGNEKIVQFGVENWWVTNMESFIRGKPSELYIQAIEDTKVLMLGKTDLEDLYVTIPRLERLFRVITENMLIAIQRHSAVYMKMNSKERYDHFVKNLPDFVQRIPQYMIASYLEITPEYLSALRKDTTSFIS